MEWQPIESAPKDGSRILAWATRVGWEGQSGDTVVCAFHSNRWAIMGAISSGAWPDTKDECTPHYWMPLPARPNVASPHAS